MHSGTDRLLTVKELAALLRLSLASVYELVQQKAIPVFRVGANRGAIRIKESDALHYLQSGMQQNNPCPTSKAPVSRPTLKHIRLTKS